MADQEDIVNCDEIKVARPALTVERRTTQYSYKRESKLDIKTTLYQKAKEKCQCSRTRLWNWFRERIPILDWLPRYPIRSALPSDLIAGVTIGIMHLPQGMAYALLASLPPVIGLYMAFFPVLLYIILGTSRHVSMGTFAIACLMMGEVVIKLSTESNGKPDISLNETYASLNETLTLEGSSSIAYTAPQVAAVLALMVGIWEILLGLFHLGELLNIFLSDMLISGFTTAVAVHVLTSQLKYLLGIPGVRRHNGLFKITYTYIDIFENILSSNTAVMLISTVCLALLIFSNEMKPRVKRYTRLPIPTELIIVVLGTIASHFGNFSDSYEVEIVGEIPTGLPVPAPPPAALLPKVVLDGLIIGIVSYSTTFSLAKVFAKKHGYQVDATQELYAQGLSNVFGSFFSCGPIAASLSRSLIQEAAGSVTLLTTFASCCFVLFILLFIGPLFEALPNCVLSAIIVAALKGLLWQFNDLKELWSLSKGDAFIWTASFVASVVLDLSYGLAVGVVASALVLILRTIRTSSASLGHIPNTDLYADVSQCSKAVILPGIRIFQYNGSLHFANASVFADKLLSNAELCKASTEERIPESKIMRDPEENHEEPPLAPNSINPVAYHNEDFVNDTGRKEKKESEDLDEIVNHATNAIAESTTPSDTEQEGVRQERVKWLVLDLSGTSFVDSTGCKHLSNLKTELQQIFGVTLCISGATNSVLKEMERCGTLNALGRECFFHSIHDAVTIINNQEKFTEKL